MSGGDNGELRLGKESLKQMSPGMKAAIGELEETGTSVTGSNRGAGFENLTLTSKQAGTAASRRTSRISATAGSGASVR